LKRLENKIKTAIWCEEAEHDNPFYARKSFCHGYDFYNTLLGRFGFSELVFLHLRGELPEKEINEHFNLLLSAVMNPGPRDLQNRAAMSAAIGGCPVGGAMISGFSCSMGGLQGGLAVEAVMRMLLDIKERAPEADNYLSVYNELAEKHNNRGIPGFGLLNAGKDTPALRLVELLRQRNWNGFFVDLLLHLEEQALKNQKPGLRLYGVFAASLLDLGFSPQQGHGLYMLASGVGMLGFLCERYEQKWYEYPTWFTDAQYRYERNGK
jgi:citrate synthase